MCHPRGQDRIDEALLASCELLIFPAARRSLTRLATLNSSSFLNVSLYKRANQSVHHGNGLIEDRLGLASL